MEAKTLSAELRDQATALYKAAPQVMQTFQSVMLAANKNGALPAKIKELIAVAISISVKCEGCIVFHMQSAIKHGATREELVEAIAVSVEMGGGPATVYAGKALAAFDELTS
ncbi:AhpD family alkylhydroperoxidase [Bradyrhizobium sp. USDA 4516]